MFVISKPPHEVLDEFYFVNFTRWLMMGIDHSPYQLPGLSIIASPFFYVFGDNWFSWRFPVVLFGMIFLFFSYKVFENIADKKTAIITSMIIVLSTTIFMHSGLMLRDIPLIALGFVGIYLYLQKRYYIVFFIIGISALIKETAFLFLVFIVMHYFVMNYKIIILKLLSRKSIIKRGMIFIGIVFGSFIIPLYAYDSIVTVYEYPTKERVVILKEPIDGQYMGTRFSPLEYPKYIIATYSDKFGNVDVVKNPIHHISLMFSKGYYDHTNDDVKDNRSIINSVFPYALFNAITYSYPEQVHEEKYNDNEYIKIHEYEFELIRTQSLVEFHWWFLAFWSIIGLIGFSIYQKIKYKIQINYRVKILVIALICFFMSYVIIDLKRDTYSYYMIYYIPFMAFGLTTVLQKIKIYKIKLIFFGVLFSVMLCFFVYSFPVLLFNI